LDFQYADYALWERERLKPGDQKLKAALEWWTREFADMPAAPTSGWLAAYKWREPPAEISPADGFITWGLDTATSERLDSLGRALNATSLAVRLATLLPLCDMAVGHDKVVVGIVPTMRTRRELQRMFGPLFDFLNVPMMCDWNSSFRDLICYTQQRLLAIRAEREIPQGALSAEFKSRGIPVFPAVLKIRNATVVPPVHFWRSEADQDQDAPPRASGTFRCLRRSAAARWLLASIRSQSLLQSIAARVRGSRDQLHPGGRQRSRCQCRGTH